MIPVYEKWVATDLSFEHVTLFNLDEYVGSDASIENSYAYFMNEHLFNKKKFKATHIPNGVAVDLEAECVSYEKLLAEIPQDIQFLGIGENGHIAFDEPGTSFDSVTHVAELTECTLGANSRFFDNNEKVPTKALSMGIASVLAAKKITCLNSANVKNLLLKNSLKVKKQQNILLPH